eukprot:TRINITY_DN3903_c0_g3_i1.p1 TRINITY_DN3903_c0_g3~~TRINITY_DN3903_c0_g3_i1.p1  ORF type:complete len:361 (-),score=78.72 TRINITY_DN3903_c0_g3_i1:564-1646(-)
MQSTHTYDVIGAGAGPVGLFLACELALAKCSVLVLEKTEENLISPMKQMPFGMRGLNAPSLDALHRRALLPELQAHKHMLPLMHTAPHQQQQQQQQQQHSASPTPTPSSSQPKPQQQQAGGGHFAGIGIDASKIDRSRFPFQFTTPHSTPQHTVIRSEMAELETVLCARAISLGADVRRGLSVTSLHQTPDGVTVHATVTGAGTDAAQAFASRWLVGCDGGRSTVRKLSGIEFAGTDPEFTGYSIQLEFDPDSAQLPMGRTVTSAGMFWQVQPGVVVLADFDQGAFHRQLQQQQQTATIEHVQDTIRRVSEVDGIKIAALHLVSTWTDSARQATSYRNGRILLAGDAAQSKDLTLDWATP